VPEVGVVVTLSDYLAELSDRSKRVEDSLVAVRDKNLDLLAARRKALHAAIVDRGEHLEDVGDDTIGKLTAPWKHARKAVERTFATVREDADQRRAYKGLARAERHADHAEQNAASAASLAVLMLDQTEYAVAEAVLARAEADRLSAAAGAGEVVAVS
jgi:hypothetical protein